MSDSLFNGNEAVVEIDLEIQALCGAFPKLADSLIEISKTARQQVTSLNSEILLSLLSCYLNTENLNDKDERSLISYLQWAKYGWTVFPYTSFDLLDSPPDSLEGANEIADQYCTSQNIQNLFEHIEKQQCSQVDFKEAVSCFNDSKFKACSLILCSLIDGELIHCQQPADIIRHGKKKISVSGSAADNLKAYIEDKIQDPIAYLCYSNLFRFFQELFLYINNFCYQPEIINRHFLVHGVFLRNINRRDCIQLFLAYHNLLAFIEDCGFEHLDLNES